MSGGQPKIYSQKSLFEELVSKTSYIHPDMLLICIIDFLLLLKLFKSHKMCSYCGLLSFDVVHNVYKVIKSGNE